MSAPPSPSSVASLPRIVALALVAHALISAGTHLAARAATTGLPPLSVAVMRMVGTALLFTAIIALHPGLASRRLPPRAEWPRFLLWGFIAGPMNQGLFLLGIERSVASHAALLYALTPIGVHLASLALRRERWHPARLLGVAIAFVGVVVLLFERGLAAALGPLVGDVLILGAVAAWVAWTLASRDLARHYSGLQLAAWTMIAAGLQAAVAAPFVLQLPPVEAVPDTAWASLGYLIAMTSVASYILWSFALARAEASQVAVFSNLQPLATAVLGWLLLHEPIGWGVVIGGGLVLAGVWRVQRSGRPTSR
jgi:drug/metabolite transporter (DMT)-like permease